MNLTYSFFQRINLFSIWFLVTFGILVNISASSVQGLNQFNDNFYFIKRHMAGVLIGVLIFNIGKKINFYSYSRLINFSIVFVTSALFFVLTYGIVRGGSRRWVDLGVINFQPSELAKPIIILWVAYQLTNMDTKFNNFFYLRRAMFLPVICCFFIYLQPDYGTTITIFGILLSQIVFSKIDFKYPVGILSLSIIPLYFLAISGSYRFNRITTWLDRDCDLGIDLLGSCFQLNQSRIAISSGGMFGLGPGTSRARWGMLPNSHTDFIASIIGEEYGFVGLLIFVIILGFLIISFYGLAISAKSEFKKLIFVGLGSWVFIQTAINLGGAVGLLPITGIVLPFISYGSSAMVALFTGIAIGYSRI
ncbi:MAG: FtsW/RodA/SpoVE family cell cycle protein [Candidatus Actinomarina sp.]|jgi:cell division protein FtsW